MKKASKEISVASKGSIAGLKALLAEEKAARAGKVTSTPASRPFTTVSNKGVSQRAASDEVVPSETTKPKKIVYIAGVAYVQGENDKEELIDVERKRWEEYERAQETLSRGGPPSHLHALEDSHRREEELERDKRTERRELIAALAAETASGREAHQTALDRRERTKLARKELIQAKAKQSWTPSSNAHSTTGAQPQTAPTAALQCDTEFATATVPLDERSSNYQESRRAEHASNNKESEPVAKKAKRQDEMD